MEFVAERFRRKVVALVNAGSNPVKLPRWSVHLIGQDYRFSICPHEFDPRTQSEKSATFRMSMSGVRVSHESQKRISGYSV